MKKLLLVFCAHFEVIKIALLVKEFQRNEENLDTNVCVTTQHREKCEIMC